MRKRGRIEDLRPGRDGKTRTLILRTQDGGRLARPFQLVIPLEVVQGGEDAEDDKLFSLYFVCIGLVVFVLGWYFWE